jgi:hypothetical protein
MRSCSRRQLAQAGGEPQPDRPAGGIGQAGVRTPGEPVALQLAEKASDALSFRSRGGPSQQRLDRLGLLSQHVFAQRSTFTAAHRTQEWQARRRRLDALGQRAAGVIGQRPQRGPRVVAGDCCRRGQQPQRRPPAARVPGIAGRAQGG